MLMNKMKDLLWSEFKSIVLIRSDMKMQYIESNAFYWIKGVDAVFEIGCIIEKADPKGEAQVDFEDNYKTNANKPILNPQQQPFASKTLPNGKKLYKREHGITSDLTEGSNNIVFTIPYPWVKIIGVEVMHGEKLDTCDLLVLDSTTGTYSGVPNYVLNQFGFNVNIAENQHEEENAYDADLYAGMQIKIVYQSQSAKTVGINFNLTEVK